MVLQPRYDGKNLNLLRSQTSIHGPKMACKVKHRYDIRCLREGVVEVRIQGINIFVGSGNIMGWNVATPWANLAEGHT